MRNIIRWPFVFATLLGRSHAFWRMFCSNIHFGRLDPIVNSGGISGHSHTVQGAANFGVNATFNTLVASRCTSCELQADKSAYWTPMLYYQFPNGSFLDVPHDGGIIYYLGRGNNKTLTPFPPGFRMISGDAAARSYNTRVLTYKDTRPIADRVSYACLETEPIPETPGFNRTECAHGLRAQIHFQSCWNGIDLYKTDQSHVAYLSGMDVGDCPPTHPYQLVHIFLEVLYSVWAIPKEPGGRLVFSSGDPTGYSFHGDFQNGWNATVLDYALKNCAFTVTGDIDKCEIFKESLIKNYAYQCPRWPSQIDEQVTGLLPKLPGCNKITEGPDRAQPADMNCPASVVRPQIFQTVDTVNEPTILPKKGQQYGLSGWTYAGCWNDTKATRILQGPFYFDDKNMTVTNCQSFCANEGYKYAGVEFGYQCFCGDQLLQDTVRRSGNQFQAECYYSCPGKYNLYCGGRGLMDVWNNTALVPVPNPSFQRASKELFFSRGCWKDAVDDRALKGPTFSSDDMTPDLCATYCLARNQKWFGVEYGRECFCGNKLRSSGIAPSADCSMVCDGNEGQNQWYCGGPARINLYYAASLRKPVEAF